MKETPAVVLQGLLDPSRVVILGKYERTGGLDSELRLEAWAFEDAIKWEKDGWHIREPGEELLVAELPFTYRKANIKEDLWFNIDGTVLVGDSYIGMDYLKLSAEFIRLMDGMNGTWRTLIRTGKLSLWFAEEKDTPVLVLGRNHGALIAPKIVEEKSPKGG